MLFSQCRNNNVFTRMMDSVWDASNPNNDTSNIPADATSLASITDTAHKGNVFVQATGASQPVYKTSIVNGNNVFRFSGAQFMTCANAASNQYTGAMSIIMCGMTTTVAASNSRFFSKVDASTGFAAGRSTAAHLYTARGVSDYNGNAGQWAASTFQVFMLVYNGSNSVSFYTNGVLDKTVAGGAVPASTAIMYMGTFAGATEFWAGDIQLIGWAWRACNAGEITVLSNAGKLRLGL